MYQIERQDELYKTLPRALFFSPIIVVFSALTLFLPLAGVFAPGSLTVATENSTVVGPCIIPTGYLSTPDTPDYASLYTSTAGRWGGASTRINALATQWLIEQRIPDLPQACGPNCRYKVHIPSFAFRCAPNPLLLPLGQAGEKGFQPSLWNGTQGEGNFIWDFYIAWYSNGPNGTWGNAFCTTLQAQYDVEVRIIALSTGLVLILFLNFDSRSRPKEVSNLLQRTSRK